MSSTVKASKTSGQLQNLFSVTAQKIINIIITKNKNIISKKRFIINYLK